MGLVAAVKELARTGELQRNHHTDEQKRQEETVARARKVCVSSASSRGQKWDSRIRETK